jgi:hypothetical protein
MKSEGMMTNAREKEDGEVEKHMKEKKNPKMIS